MNLIERLRDCGPFIASDGHMALSVPSSKDAHEAADRIEELEAALMEAQRDFADYEDRLAAAEAERDHLASLVADEGRAWSQKEKAEARLAAVMTDVKFAAGWLRRMSPREGSFAAEALGLLDRALENK